MAEGSKKNHTVYCSFCGKSEHEVRKLIAGPTVFICNECVDLAYGMCRDDGIPHADSDTPENPAPIVDSFWAQDISVGILTAEGGKRAVSISVMWEEGKKRVTHALYTPTARALAHSLRAMADAVDVEPKELWGRDAKTEQAKDIFIRYLVKATSGAADDKDDESKVQAFEHRMSGEDGRTVWRAAPVTMKDVTTPSDPAYARAAESPEPELPAEPGDYANSGAPE